MIEGASARGPRNELFMIRMAAEGIPISAIARVAEVTPALARVTIQGAKARGHIAQMPPEEWANPLKIERSSRDLASDELTALADSLRPLKLTATEALIAAALMLNGLLTRSELKAVACPNQSVQPKIVDVYVCKMRKKLQPYGAAVETLWGRGYRMDDVSRLKLMAAVGKLEARHAS